MPARLRLPGFVGPGRPQGSPLRFEIHLPNTHALQRLVGPILDDGGVVVEGVEEGRDGGGVFEVSEGAGGQGAHLGVGMLEGLNEGRNSRRTDSLKGLGSGAGEERARVAEGGY